MSVAPMEAGEAKPGAKYDRLIAAAKAIPAAATIVVHPCDESSLRGVADAAEAGIITPTLVGPSAKIKAAGSRRYLGVMMPGALILRSIWSNCKVRTEIRWPLGRPGRAAECTPARASASRTFRNSAERYGAFGFPAYGRSVPRSSAPRMI